MMICYSTKKELKKNTKHGLYFNRNQKISKAILQKVKRFTLNKMMLMLHYKELAKERLYKQI